MQAGSPLAALCAALLIAAAVAQQPQSPSRPRPRYELALALQRVDATLECLKAAQQNAAAAMRLAQDAEQHAKEAEIEAVVKAAAELQQQLDALAAAVNAATSERTTLLQRLREKAAAEAPASLLEDGSPQRNAITAATRLPSLQDAENALAKLEARFAGDDFRTDPEHELLLALTRYRLADVLRQRASAVIRAKGGGQEAEALLQRAIRKYGDVLTVPDVEDSGEGSSLHAAALRRVVQLHATLGEGYRQKAAQQPGVRANTDAVKLHREAAEQAFERIKRQFPDAVLPNGQRVVDVVRDDVARLGN